MAKEGYYQPALRKSLLDQISRLEKTIPELKNASIPNIIEWALTYSELHYIFEKRKK